MPILKLTVEYVGTSYRGWQTQPGLATVQGILSDRLAVILRHPVVTYGAARTDAGVHALGQVAHLETPDRVDAGRLRRSLNATLPPDIGVRLVEEMPRDFHARHSALGRIYRYQIVEGEFLSPFLRNFAAHSRAALDTDAMEEAAASLVGEHDFSSFRAAGDVSRTPVKRIARSDVRREGSDRRLIVYTVEATSFLQHMVRNIAGTLMQVGLGRTRPAAIPEILAARDRREAGPTAPARGLFLVRVLYGDLARQPHG